MGQKVHPLSFRIGIVKDWKSKWFAKKKDYGDLLLEDFRIRKFIKDRLHRAGISKIEIYRAGKRLRINIFAARPGIVIGRKGAEVERLKEDLSTITDKEIYLNIQEIETPLLDAQLVAESVALQLERRFGFRRAMKKTVENVLNAGAKGVRIACSGRLGGSEIARTEWYRKGRVPLHTLKADIDYGFSEAHTTYGRIGVKVWIFKEETEKEEKKEAKKAKKTKSE
jgi:small subunit ribosomal protein S3